MLHRHSTTSFSWLVKLDTWASIGHGAIGMARIASCAVRQ
jgi:hypothetical protein